MNVHAFGSRKCCLEYVVFISLSQTMQADVIDRPAGRNIELRKDMPTLQNLGKGGNHINFQNIYEIKILVYYRQGHRALLAFQDISLIPRPNLSIYAVQPSGRNTTHSDTKSNGQPPLSTMVNPRTLRPSKLDTQGVSSGFITVVTVKSFDWCSKN